MHSVMTVCIKKYFFLFLCLPLKKGAYCLVPVGQTVDKVMATQYPWNPFALKLPNLVQWIPYTVDDPYWFLNHMVKGQGQTAGHCTYVILYKDQLYHMTLLLWSCQTWYRE